MKKLAFAFLSIVLLFSANAQKATGIAALTPTERGDLYPVVNDRDNSSGGKIAPEWAYLKLQKYFMNMTAKSELARGIRSPTNTSKEYLDYIIKYYDYDLMKEYFTEIKSTYAKFQLNAPRIEVEKVKPYMVDLLSVPSAGTITQIGYQDMGYIERDIPKEANIVVTENQDEFKVIEKKAALYQTWEDYFLNGNRDAGMSVLNKLHIREWLSYEVEYCLPMAMIPEYRGKLETFLKKFGI